MKLVSPENIIFSLDIVGYEYPNNHNDYWDSNWLMVRIQLQEPEKSLTVIDPCLLTFDLQRMIDWFQHFVSHNSKIISLDTIEPSLEFTENILGFNLVKNLSGVPTLRVILRVIQVGKGFQDEYFLDFPLDGIQFSKIIEDLHGQQDRFPPRALDKRKR